MQTTLRKENLEFFYLVNVFSIVPDRESLSSAGLFTSVCLVPKVTRLQKGSHLRKLIIHPHLILTRQKKMGPFSRNRKEGRNSYKMYEGY